MSHWTEEEKKYVEDQNKCGLKVGDRVKVVRKEESYEGGWRNMWVTSMDNYIGRTFEVLQIAGAHGIGLCDEGLFNCFPYFCLEKVEDEDSKQDAITQTQDDENLDSVDYYRDRMNEKRQNFAPFEIEIHRARAGLIDADITCPCCEGASSVKCSVSGSSRTCPECNGYGIQASEPK